MSSRRQNRAAAKTRLPFRTVINEHCARGFEDDGNAAGCVPYQTKPHKLGMKVGKNLDNIQELLAQIEGEDSR